MSIRSVRSEINAALNDNYLSVREANRIVVEADKGPFTPGERALLVDLLDSVTPQRGQPLPVKQRASEASRNVLRTFLLAKGSDSPLVDELRLLSTRVSCTAGGNEGDGDLAVVQKTGPFTTLDEPTLRSALADEITTAVVNNEDLGTDDNKLSIEAATPAKLDEMFSDAYDTPAGGVEAFKKAVAKLRDPVVVQLGEGDNGSHPVWVVGLDAQNNLVGVQSEVVWT